MSKKDYELIAEVISYLNPDKHNSATEMRAAIIAYMAVRLKRENKAFNINTFLKACRPETARTTPISTANRSYSGE